MSPTNRARAASTNATAATKGGMVHGVLRSSDARPARRALSIVAASLALGVLPIRLGEIEVASDAAVRVGVVEPVADVDPRTYVRDRASRSGFTGRQWRCLDALVNRESRWNPKADNPTSSAYGLFQQLRLDPRSDLAKQTRLGLKYIAHRYGTPCRAYAHAVEQGWF